MNLYDFLRRLRDILAVGDDRIVSVFLIPFPFGDTVRIRFDFNLQDLKTNMWNHLSYDMERPAEMFLILNENNQDAFFNALAEEINAKIAKWEGVDNGV